VVKELDEAGNSGGGLFAGTAWYYARYRPGYPRAALDDIVGCLHLEGTGRLLDLGCGTGQLVLPLAAHVAEGVGIDPEMDMLTEGRRQAHERGVANVRWVRGCSVDLPAGLGRFRLVSMGRCFHWMDRVHVLTALDEIVDDRGALVILNDSNLLVPATSWQRAIADVQRRFLPPDHHRAPAPPSADGPTHEQALADSLTSTLLGIDPTGQFTEAVTLEVLYAMKID
jgi:SAM-dependent methyltransferase